jgi:hypothetical protein
MRNQFRLTRMKECIVEADKGARFTLIIFNKLKLIEFYVQLIKCQETFNKLKAS